MRRYRVLRTWSVVLVVLGIASIAAAGLGVIWWAVETHGFWDTVGVVAVGTPLAILLGALPIAVAQGLRALADIGEDVEFESLTTRATSPY